MQAESHPARRPGDVAELIARLGDPRVQARPELLDAVCRALVALDVMRPHGNGAFVIKPRHLLGIEAIDAITELGPAVPLRYLIALQV
jgi:hypothetical protein